MLAALHPAADLEATKADLVAIDQVGESMAADLTGFFASDGNRAAVEDLLAELAIIPPERPSDDSPVSGRTIVFTGTLAGMSRAEAKARARIPRRESIGVGFGEDRFPRRRRRCRVEGPQGGGARRHRSRRGRLARADRGLAKSLSRPAVQAA